MDQTRRTAGRPATARTAAPAQATRRPAAVHRARRRSPWFRALKIGAWTLGPVLALALIVVGLLYFRLSQGPNSLQPFLASIESGITADLDDGMTAKVEDAMMVMGENGVEFRLKKLEILEPDGDLVASAPLASAAVSTTDLFKFQIVPKRVFLIEPRVFLFYSDEGGLALSFSGAEGAGEREIVPPTPVPAHRPNASTVAKTKPGQVSERIDLARKLIDLNDKARRGLLASTKLREIGLRDASVVLVFAGQTSEWRVPNFVIGLGRSSEGSVISGSGWVDSGQGEWKFGFRTEEANTDNTVKVKLDVADFVPKSLAEAVPRLSLFNTLAMRVSGSGSLDLRPNGDVSHAKLDLNFGSGNINLPNVARPLTIGSGTVGLAYDGAARVLTITPSTIAWGQSNVTFSGAARQTGDAKSGETEWGYELAMRDGALAAEDLGVAPVKIDALRLAGRVIPKTGVIEIDDATLRAGGGEMSAKGEITSGTAGSSTRIEGKLANLKLDTVKALWPAAFAPGARQWVGSKLSGDVRTGSLRIVTGDYLKAGDAVEVGTAQRTSFALEAVDLKASVIDGAAPLSAARALITSENGAVELNVPEAELPAGPKGPVQIRNAKLVATDLGTIMPMGDLTFRVVSPLASALDVVRKLPESPLTQEALPADTAIDGKIDGQFAVRLPLIETVQKQDVKLTGKARISDLKAKPKTGKVELQGGNLLFDVAKASAEAKGEVILNGVVAKLQWQHALGTPEGTPVAPLLISAKLDNADRTQLGLDLNHMVQGDVPIEISVQPQPAGDAAIRFKADLSGAELVIEEVNWKKPSGRKCSLELDVGKTRLDGRIELQNMKIVGDDVAVEGHAILDPDNEMREFAFPRFSLGLVSRLELTGRQNKDKIWLMKAKGTTYDGKSFFDSLFNLEGGSKIKPRNPANGADVEAEIGTVLGYQESALKNFKMKMSTRKDKVVALEATADLEGGRSFKAVIPPNAKHRKLLAESNDAGRMFKVVGFYPNAQNGNMRMEVDLDGSGPADKTGTLVVESFQILGEPVFNELASSGQGEQRIQREVIDFDRMRVPFSVGHNQFVMSESYLRGPVMGMSMRGRIDYGMGRVNIGGTYIPLQGVNAAICDLPIFGQIVAGANCEGIFGITFALQGSNKNPEVIVNPLSLVAPGIFRDIFQMTGANPQIQARDGKTDAPAGEGTRASSSGANSGSNAALAKPGKPTKPNPAIDGWSPSDSTTTTKR